MGREFKSVQRLRAARPRRGPAQVKSLKHIRLREHSPRGRREFRLSCADDLKTLGNIVLKMHDDIQREKKLFEGRIL